MKTANELKQLADKFNKDKEDAKTIINCCEKLANKGYYKTSFNNFDVNNRFSDTCDYLEELGYIISGVNTNQNDHVDFMISWR